MDVQRNHGHLYSEPAPLEHLLLVEDVHCLGGITGQLIGHRALAREGGLPMVHVRRVMLVPLEGTHGAEHLGDVLHGDVVLRQPLNKDPVLTHNSHYFFRNSFGEKLAALVLHVTQSHVVLQLCLQHILLVALGAVVLVLKQLLCLSELWHRLEDLVLNTHVTPQLPLGGKPGNALLAGPRISTCAHLQSAV